LVVSLGCEAGGLLSDQLPVCLIFASTARISHSFIKVCVFGECIQYTQTGLKSPVQEITAEKKTIWRKKTQSKKIDANIDRHLNSE
jgi:hypothetical protein